MWKLLVFNRVHILALLLFMSISCIYYLPQLQGKVVNQSDVVSFNGMVQETSSFNKLNDEDVLWTNAMFGGMPTYQIGGYGTTNFVSKSLNLLKLFFADPIGVMIFGMISCYILCLTLGISPLIGIIVSIAFALGTNNIVLWEAGHTTKVNVIASSFLVIAGMVNVFQKNRLLFGSLIFSFGMALNLSLNHIQMTYYLVIGLIIYGFALFIDAIRSKEIASFLKQSAVLVLAGLIALGPSAGTMLPTYEYSKDTMRGDAILKTNSTQDSQSSSETDGLAWDYATQWSAGMMDLLNVIVPRSSGGSSAEKMSTKSATYIDLKNRGVNLGKDFRVPLYWGSMGSTSGIYYFGATIIFFLLVGAQVEKGPLKYGLSGAIVLTMIIALGRNFELFNKFLFDYLPLFNKFRSPSSVLGITSIFVITLSALGLNQVLRQEKGESLLKALKVSLLVSGLVCLFLALLGPSLFSFENSSDSRLVQAGYNIDAIMSDRHSALRSDAFRSLFFILIAFGLSWSLLKNKISITIFSIALGVLVIFDLWPIANRYLSHSDFVRRNKVESTYQPRAADLQIFALENRPYKAGISENDSEFEPFIKGRGNYRVLDLSENTFNSSRTSFFHNTIGGYSPAKLQRYQDIIDRCISKGNQKVLNMLNMKYLIQQDGQLQINNAALGNAWYVDKLIPVNTPMEEIDALNSFSPDTEAVIIDKEFPGYLSGFSFSKNGAIVLEDYNPMKMTYSSRSDSEQFAVFSEIWYGPDKGWNAYIDGVRGDHVRVNYLLRGMRIPAGSHSIEFRFEPKSAYWGGMITFITSLLLILALGIGILFALRDWYQQSLSEMNPAVVPSGHESRNKINKKGRNKN